LKGQRFELARQQTAPPDNREIDRAFDVECSVRFGRNPRFVNVFGWRGQTCPRRQAA
jgi:hypothetical protein